mgnify:CR=1 FL=1|jgi:hypothetical protein
MEINLPDIDSEDYEGVCKDHADIIMSVLAEVSRDKHNYLIVPMRVYNILHFSDNFYSVNFSEISPLMLAGHLEGFEVYLDLYMPPDEILISYDKSIERENKLDILLNSEDAIKEKRVKIT